MTNTKSIGTAYEDQAIVNGSFTGGTIDGTTLTNTTLVIPGTTFDSATYTNSTISDAAISNGTIDGAAVTNGTVDGADITSGTIDGAAITNGTVDSAAIGGTTPAAGAFTTLKATSAVSAPAPGAVITAATYSVGASDYSLIFAGSAANVAVTMPSASANSGRILKMVNQSGTYTVISAGSNVLPIAGGAAGTAILAATAGAWAELQSNGTNWQIMASN